MRHRTRNNIKRVYDAIAAAAATDPAKDEGYTHYDSVDAFLDVLKSRNITGYSDSDNVAWMGDTWAGAVEKATSGDLSAVDKANAIIDQIDADLDVSGLRPQWGDAVVGSYANVPAFLAGSPESMRARTPAPSPKGPMTIWYCPVSSTGVTADQAYRRGCTVLALVLAMQRVRPVQVRLATVGGVGDHTVAIRTEPMVLAEAAHCVTATSFWRGLFYGLASSYGWNGCWPGWYMAAGSSEAEIDKALRKHLGAEPDDLVVPPACAYHGTCREMIETPAKWINRVIDQYRNR